MTKLGALVCGLDRPAGLANDALNQLKISIDNFEDKALFFLREDFSSEAANFGPFCARVILENSFAAIMGRIDAFRILYLNQFQSQPEYEKGKRARSAFSWSGDVIPDEKQNSDLWSTEHDTSRISRALFSRHTSYLHWRPAISDMLDFVNSLPHESAFDDIKSIEVDNFIDRLKGQSVQLYSVLSKGVHWEFFSSTLVFDETTVKGCIRDVISIVSQLALASHFVPTAHSSLSPDNAVKTFLEVRRALP